MQEDLEFDKEKLVMFRKTADLASLVDERNDFYENASDVATLVKQAKRLPDKEFSSFLMTGNKIKPKYKDDIDSVIDQAYDFDIVKR